MPLEDGQQTTDRQKERDHRDNQRADHYVITSNSWIKDWWLWNSGITNTVINKTNKTALVSFILFLLSLNDVF